MVLVDACTSVLRKFADIPPSMCYCVYIETQFLVSHLMEESLARYCRIYLLNIYFIVLVVSASGINMEMSNIKHCGMLQILFVYDT